MQIASQLKYGELAGIPLLSSLLTFDSLWAESTSANDFLGEQQTNKTQTTNPKQPNKKKDSLSAGPVPMIFLVNNKQTAKPVSIIF